MVFVCYARGTVSIQVIEGKSTDSCLDRFNKFFCEKTIPKLILTVQEGGLMKSLKEGEIIFVDLSGTMFENKTLH